MTRERNREINSMVQVVDANGDKVTDAIVNFKVYFYDTDINAWGVDTSGLMTHVGDGIYTANWEPHYLGEFVFYAYCSNPKFHESYTYNIEKGAKNKIWVQQEGVLLNYSASVQSQYAWILSVQGGVRVDVLKFCQTNNEAAQKTIAFRIFADGGSDKGFSVGVPNNTWYNVGLQSSVYGWSVLADSIGAQAFGINYNVGGSKSFVSQPFECRRIDISVACTDMPGTNQKIYAYCMYAVLEDLDEDDETNPV